MKTTLLSDEYTWSSTPESGKLYENHSLYNADGRSVGFIVRKEKVQAYYYPSGDSSKFDTIEDAKRWCEMMVITGA